MNKSNMLLNKRLLLVASFILTFGASAQTGPAGVGTSANNQYWLDAHSLGFPDGTALTTWTDISGNGNDFNQFSAARRPIYTAAGIGGFPTVTFDGINDVLVAGANSSIETPEISYFIVYDRIGTGTGMLINANYASTFRKWRSYFNNARPELNSVHFSPSSTPFVNKYNDLGPASFTYTALSSTGMNTRREGNLLATSSGAYTSGTGHNNITLGGRSALVVPSYNFNGPISEVIVYNGAINDLERIFIENYLGAKYNMAIPTDLYAYNATHRLGLIGIGNDGTNIQATAQGAGILELSGAVGMTAGEFFVVANTDFPVDEYNEVDLPPGLPAHQRLQRTWRVGETGDVGTTTLTFKLGADADYAEPASYRLLVDSDGVFADASTFVGVYDAGTQSVTFTVDLNDGDFFTLSGIEEILFIHSITDGNWGDPTTWDCTCIPGANDLVFIDPGTTVTVDVDGFTDYLKVEFTGTLVMDTDVTLDVNGDFDITGATDFTAGTISLTGDEAQDVTIITSFATTVTFNDLLIENTSVDNVTFLNRTFEVSGTLSPTRGNIVFDPSTTFIITSTSATTSGRVGPIISPTTLTGGVTVQRFIPAGNADFRNLCSPVIGSDFNDWDPDLAMSGTGFPDGCAFGPDGCYFSVMRHEGDFYYAVVNSTDPILNGRGFEVYCGDDLETFSGTTLNSRGTLNTSADVTKTIPTGWAIIGNPYASPISFNTIDKTSQIGNYYYVYDSGTGSFQWYDQASGTSSVPEITGDGLVAMGQGIWVKASSLGTLTFRQSDKSDQSATFIRTSELGSHALSVKLSQNDATYSCSILLEEFEFATDLADDSIDIYHLRTGIEKGPGFAVNSSNELLRKNYIRKDGRDKSFELTTQVITEGYYTITAENWANFREYQKIILFDKLTGESVDLKQEEYVFYSMPYNPEAKTNSRFTLLLTNAADGSTDDLIVTSATDESELVVLQMGHVIDVQAVTDYEELTTITVTNILGQTEVFVTTTTLVAGSNIVTLPESIKGFHIITLRTGDKIVSHKVVL